MNAHVQIEANGLTESIVVAFSVDMKTRTGAAVAGVQQNGDMIVKSKFEGEAACQLYELLFTGTVK